MSYRSLLVYLKKGGKMAAIDGDREWMVEAGRRVPRCRIRDWFYSKFVTLRSYDDYPEVMSEVSLLPPSRAEDGMRERERVLSTTTKGS